MTEGEWTQPRHYRNQDGRCTRLAVYGGGRKVPASAGLRVVFIINNPNEEDEENARHIVELHNKEAS